MADHTQPLRDYLQAQLDEVDRRKKIGAQIRAARVASGSSQVEMADFIDITPAYLCLLENGRKHPSAKTMSSIVSYFSMGGTDAQDQDEDS